MKLNPTEEKVLTALKRLRGNPQAVAARLFGRDYTSGEHGNVKRAMNSLVMRGLVCNIGGIYEVIGGDEKQAPATAGEQEGGVSDVARDPVPEAEDSWDPDGE